MAKLKVASDKQDVSLSHVKRLSIDIGSKSIKTPSRALVLRDSSSESRLIKNRRVRGINEVYRELSKEKVEDIDGDRDKLNEFAKTLRYAFESPNASSELNLLFFAYENKDKKDKLSRNTVPTNKEIESLCSIASYPKIDLIIPPHIPGISGENYLTFLKSFFEALKSYGSDFPVMGFLPFVNRQEFTKIANFYFEQGINCYAMDFAGTNPIDNYIIVAELRKLSKRIETERKLDTYLHAFNVPMTKVKQKVDVTPAKDIMTFAMGFDSFGTSHIPNKLPKEVIEEIIRRRTHGYGGGGGGSGTKMPRPSVTIKQVEVFRVFNRNDYGYYRSNLNSLPELLEDKVWTSIPLKQLYKDGLSENKLRSIRKAFNVEKQGLEAVDLRQVIEESSISKHLESKPFAKDNLRYANKIA